MISKNDDVNKLPNAVTSVKVPREIRNLRSTRCDICLPDDVVGESVTSAHSGNYTHLYTTHIRLLSREKQNKKKRNGLLFMERTV